MLIFYMSGIGKSFALFLILIMAFSCLNLLVIKSASAQTIPIPSVPEFTVSFVNSSYTTPITTTQTTNPFTGQQVTQKSGGQYVENLSIDVIIKYEPYAPVTLPNGTVIQLYYTVQTKGHFEEWQPVLDPPDGYDSATVQASTTGNTIVNFGANPGGLTIPVGGEEDFRVEAKAGYMTPYGVEFFVMGYTLETVTNSSWSSTQTITMPENIPLSPTSVPTSPLSPTPVPTSSTSSSAPTATPQNLKVGSQTKTGTGVNWIVIALSIALAVTVALVVVVAMIVRHRKTANLKQ